MKLYQILQILADFKELIVKEKLQALYLDIRLFW